MKKKIIIATTFAACLALCAAVWPQAETIEETPAPHQTTTVSALPPTLPESEKLVLTVTTEEEMVGAPEAEPAPEAISDDPATPAPVIENQAEVERESSPPAQSGYIQTQPTQPEPEPTPEPELESNKCSSENMVYVPGFGWIESQGPNHVEYAEDMYENGNKIGCMG